MIRLKHCTYLMIFKHAYIIAIFASISATSAFALPLISDIAQTPLELTPTVETNIVILFDDSGSMGFEVMTADALSSGLVAA